MLKKAYKGDAYEEKERERTICQVANYKYSIFARQVKKKLRSTNTLKRWHCTKRKLRQFLHFKFGKWDVLLSAIKHSHAQDFMNYLTLQDGIEENPARKYIKNLKELLQIAADRGWLAGNPWANYRIGYDQPERQYLSMQDIMKLYRKPLLDRLDHVRNIFLFACFTGYAFQEVQNLTPDDVFTGDDGKRWIKIDRRKTGRPECLPLLPIPASIIDRYKDDLYCKAHHRLLPVKSYQNYNSYLKEVGYLCGVTTDFLHILPGIPSPRRSRWTMMFLLKLSVRCSGIKISGPRRFMRKYRGRKSVLIWTSWKGNCSQRAGS